MRGNIFAILSLLFFAHTGYTQSYGLRFSSHEVVQEKRTSLNLSPSEPLCFKNGAEISFDLLFAQNMEVYFGYIFRFITSDSQNIDLIYNPVHKDFNLIVGETVAGNFKIDSVRLFTEWSHVAFSLDTRTHEILLYVNDRQVGKCKTGLKSGLCFKMSFGTNNFDEFQTADIPPMSIKDIRLAENGKIRYYWPLSEISGDECYDSVQRSVARVKNPGWIRPQHQAWKLAGNFQVKGTPSVAFDPKNENLFVVAEDSLYSLSLMKLQLTGQKWGSEQTEILPAGNQSIYSPRDRRLYNVYVDQKKVRTFDFENKKWDVDFSPGPLTEFWHAGKFLSAADSCLYVMDGYGQQKYKNLVQRYNFAEKKWEIVKTRGDYFTPRYLAAVGTNARGDTAFIMGGYGSTTGDQMVNPRYYYDLLQYSVKDRSFKVLYHFKDPDEPFCFANSLIIDSATHEYYGLIYPNDKFNSRLQLINGSLGSPGYRLLGDGIPYSFYDVKSFADLYYCPVSKQLIAVTFYTSKEDITDVKIYTIAFPPNAIVPVGVAAARSFPWIYLLLIPVIGIGWFSMTGIVKKRAARRRESVGQRPGRTAPFPGPGAAPALAATISGPLSGSTGLASTGLIPLSASASAGGVSGAGSVPGVVSAPAAASGNASTPAIAAAAAAVPAAAFHYAIHPAQVSELTARVAAAESQGERSSIFFFGQFEVYDRTGVDLTKQFTPLLKEMFLLIAIYTLRSGKGISSEKLYATLWRDKSNKDAQNNRSVNMVKLKGILDKLGTCGIVKEADKWIFHYSPDQIRMDLAEFLTLLHIPQPGREEIRMLLTMIHRGAFLADTAYPWLDDIQSEMSDKALDTLSAASLRFSSDTEFLLEIAGGIFLFDPVNEEALKVKCKSLGALGRHSMAKAAFEKFAREYHLMYGEDFQQTFHEILSN